MTVVLILQLAVIKQMRAHWRPQQPPLPHPKIGASVLHPTTTTTSSVSSTIEKKQGKTKKTKAKKMTKRKERRKGTRKKADGKKKKKAVSTSHRSLDTTEAGTVDLYTSPFGAKIKLDKTMTDSMASPAGGRSKATGDTKSKEKESSKDSSKGDEQADESTSNLYIRRK
ncbi:hypothetical protein ANCCAN_21604 [Ancylostoma caninum]|uniref:Uncharacterized protein n=1 Tax=Ancylostoma caninum TaxID=29170 RepID=A0A368FK81_ANCCA|nr:hypothetical protein ANCCAN_21604 [Ancylostoma caninum]